MIDGRAGNGLGLEKAAGQLGALQPFRQDMRKVEGRTVWWKQVDGTEAELTGA